MLNAQGKTNPQSVEAHGGLGFDEAIYDALNITKPVSGQVVMASISTAQRQIKRLTGKVNTTVCFRVIPEAKKGTANELSKATPRNMVGTIDKLFNQLKHHNDQGCGIYFTVNEGGTKASEITRIRAIYADFDDADARAGEAIAALLPHLIVQSSEPHKQHVYWLVSDCDVSQAKTIQDAIAIKYGSDKNATDIARVLRLAGFSHRKAVPVMVKIVAESEAQPYTVAQLIEGLGITPQHKHNASDGNSDSILTSFGIEPNTAKSSVFADIDRAKLSEALPFIEPEKYEIWFKVGMALHPLGDEGFQMWDSWSAQSPKYPGQNELRGKWDSFKDGEGVGFGTVFHLAKQNGFVINPPALSTADAPQTLHVIPFDIPKVFTELAVAEAVHKAFGLLLRYVPQTGKWHVVDEHNVWREDLTGKVDRCVVAVLKESKKYVCTLIMNGGNDKVNSMLREINKAEKYGFTVGTVSHLRSLEGMTMNSCHFDADPLLVGLAGGQVLDLRTSTVRPLLPEDYISKTLGTRFDAAATCPRWIQFIDEVTCGDKELAIYLQVVAGYCLSGLNELHVFWLMVGSGRNGKTVLLNTLMELLAEYAVMLPAEAITLRSNGGDNLSDLARLDRNRLAVTSEIAEGSHYNENRLKGLSGGDRITARRLYSEPYDFENRAKVLQAANYRPIVKGTDAAIWDRLQMVPFNAYFDKPDRQLTDKLKSELSGILNWCVAGWKIYQVKGLEIPAAVANESNAYKQEQDLTAQFLDQTCKVVVGSKIKSSELYARFKTWCLDNGFYVPNSSTFGRRIGNRLKSKREASGVFYLDVRMY